MHYQELIAHLYNLKILSHLDRYKNTYAEYSESLIECEKAQTKLNWVLEEKKLRASLDYIDVVYMDAHRANIIDEFDRLLKKSDFKEPLAGILPFTLNNLVEYFNPTDFKEVDEYLFGNPHFNKNFKHKKSKEEILKFYIELLESNSFGLSFIDYYSYLEPFSIEVGKTYSSTIKGLLQHLKTLSEEKQAEYIRDLFTRYQNRINQSSYILVGTTLNSEKYGIEDIASILNWFIKLSPFKQNQFEEQRENILQFFIDSYFVQFLIDNHSTYLQDISIDVDKAFNLFENRNQLHEVCTPDNIEDFKDVEKQLINEGYFNRNGKWVKGKETLIRFLFDCNQKGYFQIRIEKKNRTLLRKFFEKRYLIDIANVFKPSYLKKVIDKNPTQFNWIKKAH